MTHYQVERASYHRGTIEEIIPVTRTNIRLQRPSHRRVFQERTILITDGGGPIGTDGMVDTRSPAKILRLETILSHLGLGKGWLGHHSLHFSK